MPERELFLAVTRAAYDTVAVDYAVLLEDELQRKPWDRAVLSAYAELVLAAGGGPVLEVGCGPAGSRPTCTRSGWTSRAWTCHRGWSTWPDARTPIWRGGSGR